MLTTVIFYYYLQLRILNTAFSISEELELLESVNFPEKSKTESTGEDNSEELIKALYTYREVFRDPFSLNNEGNNNPAVNINDNTLESKNILENRINLDNVYLLGIIINSEKKLAILNNNGNTIFLKENDRFNELTVKRILKDVLILTYNNIEYYLDLGSD
jgi:type II secretory pathway component PulC